ncbi:MAG TPA: hypothetical protein PKM65_11845 [Spirochaetota bacterium]|nr:hypothetical protein [Spirochaetota bacterium]HNT09491.1 hypothetical protein [Spirochaetota bacterium]HNV45913.1 hypothetical protein [Spirochaetota bacterium]HOS38783.1 hypothetical protein [Spirochaetota bacterium]HPI21716.1 hypothetical protein [Spirochaetota bacterium]
MDTKKKRTKLILHKIQVRTTMSVMGIVFLGVAIIIALIAVSVNYNHNQLSDIIKKNSHIIHRIDNIAAIQDNVVEDLMTYSYSVADPRQKLAIQEFAMDHYKNITAIKKNVSDTKNNITTVQNILRFNNILLIAIIVIVVVQGIVLYYLGIRISHKFTGPIMVISDFLRDFIEGKKATLRPLRKDDELREFYYLFARAVKMVRQRERDLHKRVDGK